MWGISLMKRLLTSSVGPSPGPSHLHHGAHLHVFLTFQYQVFLVCQLVDIWIVRFHFCGRPVPAQPRGGHRKSNHAGQTGRIRRLLVQVNKVTM